MSKPIIGIVAKHFAKEYIRPDTYIRDEVKQAILDNGGIPIGILPPDNKINQVQDKWQNNLSNEEYNNLISQIQLCDGIIFQGGGATDNYEMIAAKYCYEQDIPTLGLCCGQNTMVRALGGTTKRIGNPERHDIKDQEFVHPITILKDTRAYQLIQKEEIIVNSRHKKVIEKTILTPSAYDDDGNIEILEDLTKKFYISFRFHPESIYKQDSNINNIFVEFINTCK